MFTVRARTSLLPEAMICRHFSLPSVPTHNSNKSPELFSTDVRKIRSPHTAGVAPPGPGNGNRHATFSVFDHFVGVFVSFEMPLFFGPRHCGQFSARTVLKEAAHPIRATTTADRANRVENNVTDFMMQTPYGN
jgi:hypothetical protein